MERIAILCSGGDSQGMNTAIYTIVKTCHNRGILPIGVRKGYKGLIDNDFIFLTEEMVHNIYNLGGSYLNVARSAEFMTKKGLDKAVANLKKNAIDGLVVIGGNGSFRGAEKLIENGIKVIAIPGTIDNDLFYTDNTLGFDTAVNNAVDSIEIMRQSLEANDRGLIVGVMGRDCGAIALSSAVATFAPILACRELGTTIAQIVKDYKILLAKGVLSPLVIVSENCSFTAEDVSKAIIDKLKVENRFCDLGYLARGGAPSILDRQLALNWGVHAVRCLESGSYGVALGWKNNSVITVPIKDANKHQSFFDKQSYVNLRSLYNLK